MSKLIIFTAPSGAGKTTIVRHLLEKMKDQLAFSVSATTRARRPHEINGKDYYFLTPAEFRHRISIGDFLEWEEVYDDQFYGTLRSEVDRIWALGKAVLFDIDVRGATNIKQAYPEQTLAIFVKPPSPEILFERLKNRRTETPESLKKRIARATEELSYENRFDQILVNDVLENTLQTAENLVDNFCKKKCPDFIL